MRDTTGTRFLGEDSCKGILNRLKPSSKADVPSSRQLQIYNNQLAIAIVLDLESSTVKEDQK